MPRLISLFSHHLIFLGFFSPFHFCISLIEFYTPLCTLIYWEICMHTERGSTKIRPCKLITVSFINFFFPEKMLVSLGMFKGHAKEEGERKRQTFNVIYLTNCPQGNGIRIKPCPFARFKKRLMGAEMERQVSKNSPELTSTIHWKGKKSIAPFFKKSRIKWWVEGSRTSWSLAS